MRPVTCKNRPSEALHRMVFRAKRVVFPANEMSGLPSVAVPYDLPSSESRRDGRPSSEPKAVFPRPSVFYVTRGQPSFKSESFQLRPLATLTVPIEPMN
jgi:hypothetical protein